MNLFILGRWRMNTENETQPVTTPTYAPPSRTETCPVRRLCKKDASPHCPDPKGEKNFSWALGRFNKYLHTWHSLSGYHLPEVKTASPGGKQCSPRSCTGLRNQSVSSAGTEHSNAQCPLAQLLPQHHCHSASGWLQVQSLSQIESGKTARTSLIWQHSCYLLKFLSTPSAESVPVLLPGFTLCLSKGRPPDLCLQHQQQSRGWQDTGSQTLIDDTLPKEAGASNKDRLKTWFMCVWQFRHRLTLQAS